MNEYKIYFITGVCGTGKTTALHILKEILLKDKYALHDLDERGVPKNAGREWRINETKYLISVGEENFKKGLNTVVTGFSRPSEIKDLAPTLKDVFFILLDANEKTIENRLQGRYGTEEKRKAFENKHEKTVEKFVEENVNFSNILKKELEEYKGKIIDTNNKTPEEVGQEVLNILL